MKGKRVVITGPTSGIGKEIAEQLAALGADLVLACRDVNAGARTAAEIARRTGSKSCTVMHIDTSSRASIREFAQHFRSRHPRLDVLVNNAGIHRTQRHTSADGIELTFATNVLGYHLVTRELLDTLRASAPARIVNVASTFAGSLDLDDPQFVRRAYVGREAYSQSKACDRLLTWAVARRLQGSGVTANAMAPGLVQTQLYRDTPAKIRLILRVVGVFRGRSVTQGADTATWLASSPDVEGVSGEFFERRQRRACEFRNEAVEERLWSMCESLGGGV